MASKVILALVVVPQIIQYERDQANVPLGTPGAGPRPDPEKPRFASKGRPPSIAEPSGAKFPGKRRVGPDR